MLFFLFLFVILEFKDTRVAIKKIKDTFENLIDAKRILREIKILRHFSSHENIVTILDIMTYPPNTVNFKDIYIVIHNY